MGLGAFLKNVGSKIFGGGETPEEQAVKVKNHIAKYGFNVSGLQFAVENDKVTITGNAQTWQEKHKIYVSAGNVEGIDGVIDHMTVREAALEAAPAAQNQTQTAVNYYTVQDGDNLSKIAKEIYGNANDYTKIFEANKPMLTDPDKIYPGQVLVLP